MNHTVYPMPAQVFVDTSLWAGNYLLDPETRCLCIMGWVCIAAGMPEYVIEGLMLYSMAQFHGHTIEGVPKELAQHAMILNGLGDSPRVREQLCSLFHRFGMELVFV